MPQSREGAWMALKKALLVRRRGAVRAAVGRGYNLGQAKGTGNLMADLHFTYRDY